MPLSQLLGLAKTINREHEEADAALVDKEVLRRARKRNKDVKNVKDAMNLLAL